MKGERMSGHSEERTENKGLTAEHWRWAEEFIAAFRHRPGYRVTLESALPQATLESAPRQLGLVIRLKVKTVDVDRGGMPAEVGMSRHVDAAVLTHRPGREAFLAALSAELMDAILELDRHETMEWFQVGGVKVYDPHPGGLSSSQPDYAAPNLFGLDRPTPTVASGGAGFRMADPWFEDRGFYQRFKGAARTKDQIEAAWAEGRMQQDQEMGFQWHKAPGDVSPYLVPLPVTEPLRPTKP